MADTSKTQKLVSARKRFKELKEQKKNATNNTSSQKPPGTNKETNNDLQATPLDSTISSTQSPVHEEIEAGGQFSEENTTAISNESSNLTNYFNNGLNYPPAASFFDGIGENRRNSIDHETHIFNTGTFDNNTVNTFNNYSFQYDTPLRPLEISAQENEGQGIQNVGYQIPTTQDAVAEEDPEIKLNEIYDLQQSKQDNLDLIENLEMKEIEIVNQTTNSPITQVNLDSPFPSTVPVSSNLEAIQPISNVENILQLSNQVAQLIEPNSEFSVRGSVTELERRNLQLAANLEEEQIKVQTLNITIANLQEQLTKLETNLQEANCNSDVASKNEIIHLKEELQLQTQKVGIFVAENTELTSNLNQALLNLKQKTSECEEMQNRLKASRSRVSDLEKEMNAFKLEKSQTNNFEKEQVEILNKLQVDYQQVKDERDELTQDLLEIKEKLRTSSELNEVLQKQVTEYRDQLSLADIKIQQLRTLENSQVDGQIEKLVQEKFALEKQINDLSETLKVVTKERDESNLQYQQYAQQLNAQLTNLASKLEQVQLENESLVVQEQNRVKHIGELERQLQSLQNDHVSFAMQRSSGGDYRKELQLAMDNLRTIEEVKVKLQDSYTKVCNEKEMLLKDLESKKHTIVQLEDLVSDLKGNQPDSTKLLAAMESDKVAASRAISQNIDMKKQLDGMQEVFLKLNNDKVELTEKLAKEQHYNKELFEKLQKTETHLSTLADAIEVKDKEMSNLRNNFELLNKETLQQGQLADRLRHYEAQEHGSNSLQNELQEAKHEITKLTNEINILKYQNSKRNLTDSSSVTNEVNEEKLDETDSIREELNALKIKNAELESKLRNDELDHINHDSNLNILDKETAMKHLEQKFLQTMEDIANLTEEKQRLEHIVLQLQGETETIGEYVALYQHQRSVLKQKALEKDQQLKQLASDREQMKNKLEHLNDLVKKLVLEKGAVTTELLEHQENLNKHSHELCEEHAKIHQEINKITQESIQSSSEGGDRNASTETAQQIIELLSEIKSSNLVQPTADNFHHCPWCSGQLITV